MPCLGLLKVPCIPKLYKESRTIPLRIIQAPAVAGWQLRMLAPHCGPVNYTYLAFFWDIADGGSYKSNVPHEPQVQEFRAPGCRV